ncbi:hypothetical protein BDN67DRAFT_985369 [Paxillus ammoniavirescens]|nr:hypothetical protein BDN67DRAFT_985369 [Paxillus ammoniavirescens]
MLLSNSESHSFSYARVLSIYHGNIIYCGPGSLDYKPRQLEFLWFVLDKLHFVPMVDEEAFGFVDPSDVLRSCHLIPGFSTGKLHRDGLLIATCCSSITWEWVLVMSILRFPTCLTNPRDNEEVQYTTLAASSGNGDNHDHHEEASLTLTDHEMADWDESESDGGG